MTYPKIYTFTITGGSPFDGHITVLAISEEQAMEAAQEHLDELNEKANGYAVYKFRDEEPRSAFSTATVPQIIDSDTGER